MEGEAYTTVTTTVDAIEVAERIATALLDAKLAACVQIAGPIESHYLWHGVRQRAKEWLCTIKTRSVLFAAVERTIIGQHTYETPEIIAMPLASISRAYAAWIDATTNSP